MAVLTPEQLAEMRRGIAADAGIGAINYDKPTVNLALQAIEDWWIANQASLNTAINNATAPFVFTVAQKKILGLYWLWSKFRRGG